MKWGLHTRQHIELAHFSLYMLYVVYLYPGESKCDDFGMLAISLKHKKAMVRGRLDLLFLFFFPIHSPSFLPTNHYLSLFKNSLPPLNYHSHLHLQ